MQSAAGRRDGDIIPLRLPGGDATDGDRIGCGPGSQGVRRS